ncbi:lactosylceramide 4-alpha-galactosyltransferase-like [Photinus pyralis]|uniref:lactosylceramide 4-alpha-galactosyltransferase-like n=1 Tax=Photinus pyralis TaxID=7054 RepID=UPI00126775C1|nr:lactosylceramide 4-alpha-galactosyltransferase-like [Photinus pyralis]
MEKLLLLFFTITVIGMVYYVHLHPSSKESKIASLACYVAGGIRLPDLFEMKTPPDNSIYFIDTSCKSFTEGAVSIDPRQACAVESAALSNPDYQTYLLYTSSGFIGDESTLSGKLLHTLTEIKNVKLLWLNFTRLLEGTIVEDLYTSGKIQSSKFPVNTASNIASLLLLLKFGGIYLDLDFVIIRPFDDLASNFAVAESESVVNNAVLRSNLNDSGQEFIRSCLKELRGNAWGQNGPEIVTKVLEKMCNVTEINEMYQKNCSGVTVYPPDYFYPIDYKRWKLYFDSGHKNDLYHILASHGIRVWNMLSKDARSDSEESIYRAIAKAYCPQVYSIASEYF